MLGDLGADVIKVEQPGQGDDTRKWGPPFLADGSRDSAYYLCANRNKRSVVCNFRDAQEAAALKQLIIEHADVRRMLAQMKAEVFSARAIGLACAVAIDMARATGLPLRKVRPEVVRETYRMILADTPKYTGAHFAALKRILDREEADYAR